MILSDIFSHQSLFNAFKRTIRTKAKHQLDEELFSEIMENPEDFLYKIEFELVNGIYTPLPAIMVDDRKNIAIIPVKDRIVQYAVLEALKAEVEKYTIDTNYGYISGRSAFQAIDHINHAVSERNIKTFYKCDIKSFFQNIVHEMLLNCMKEHFGDEISGIIARILKTGVCHNDGKAVIPEKGILPGSPLAPLLSNLYLLDTDKALYDIFDLYVRYSDDILAVCNNFNLEETHRIIREKLSMKGLLLNEEKSCAVDIVKGFVFLGHEFRQSYNSTNENELIIVGQEDMRNIGLLFKTGDYNELLSDLRLFDNLESLNIKSAVSSIKDLKDGRGCLALIIAAARNDLPMEDEEIGFLADVLRLEDLSKVFEAARQANDMDELIGKLVDILIENSNFILAQQLNSIYIKDKTDNLSDIQEMTQKQKRMYLELFMGRANEYARGYCDIQGKRNYYKIRTGLSSYELDKMLDERHSVGIYLIDTDNLCRIFVLDVDIDRRIILNAGDDSTTFNNILKRAKEYTLELKKRLNEKGLKSFVVFSGYKGYHLWLLFKEHMEPSTVADMLKSMISEVYRHEGVNVEIIPSMTFDDDELIRLPLSWHELSNRQSVFLNENGEPVDNQYGFIEGIVENDGESIGNILSVIKNDCEKGSGNSNKSVVLQKKRIEDFPDAVTMICKGCSLIKSIIDRALKDNYLTHYERNAVLYVFGHVHDTGKQFVHYVISKCLNYNFEVTEGFISRLKEKPVSCQKLKMRFQEKYPEALCNCQFDDYPLFYPSPVIFALRVSEGKATKPDYTDNISRLAEISKVNDAFRLNTLSDKLLEISKRKREAEKELKMCCDELESIFQVKGISECEVPAGKLIYKEGEWILKVL